MKKKALVAGVLLSVFSMGMSAQAAMTISDAGETKLSNSNTNSWMDIWSDATNPGLSIVGDNEKIIKFIIDSTENTGDNDDSAIIDSNSGNGIYHDAGETKVEGAEVSIMASNTSLGENLGYRGIYNSSGSMMFNNDVLVSIYSNREAILNNGKVNFSGNKVHIWRVYTTRNPSDLAGAMYNTGDMSIDSNDITIVSTSYRSALKDGIAIINNGVFELNPRNLAGNYIIRGDIHVGDTIDGSSKTLINLRSDNDKIAQFTGDIKAYNYFYADSNDFQFNLTGSNAAWFLNGEGESYVPNVSLKDNAVICINYGGLISSGSQYNNFKNLNLNNLKNDGTGLIQLTTDLKNDVGDRVTLFFNDQTPTLSSLNIGIINKDDNNGVEIKESDGHSVTIARVEGTEKIKLNTYLSFYNHSDEGEIKLMNPIIKEEAFSNMHDMLNGYDYNFVGWKAGGTKTLYKEKDQEPIEPWINHVELDNTLKRINDIRTDPSEVGAWLRGENGKMKIRSYGYKYNLMSGGYDWKYESDAAKMFLGFGISYAKNNCDTGIIGDTKSMGYNLYGSWLGRENNDYVDVIVKYGTLDKKYAGLDDNNVFVTGDYDKKLFSVAAKYGRRITRDDGWYYEPSVGLTWGRIGSADFTDSQGINIHADSSTSKMATLGMQVGKNIQGTEFYGLLQVRHDFDGKMHVSVPGSDLPGSSVYDDMGGIWYKVGIGAARKINKNNSFYMDIEKDFGNKVKKPYAIGAGYRYTF